MIRRLSHIALFLALALGSAACDNAEDPLSDSERIVGIWNVQTVNVDALLGISVPVLDVESGGDDSAFDFMSDGSFAFAFDPADGRMLTIPNTGVSVPVTQTVNISGTYTLDGSAETIQLTSSGLPGGVTMDYDFSGSTGLNLSFDDPGVIGLLLGLADSDLSLIANVITGGSFDLRKN